MDFSGYQPSLHALERLKVKDVDFVAVVGPTAVGKTTVMKAAISVEPSLTMVLNNTSRARRPGEQDGVDYLFKNKEEMLERISRHEYVQVAPSLLGEIYATAPEDYPEQGVGMLAVLADAIDTFRALPFKSFRVIFVVPPDWQEWQTRMKAHGFEPIQLAKRLAEARRSFEYALKNHEVLFVVNNDVNTAALDFAAIAHNDPISPRQVRDQTRARDIIQHILAKL